MVTNVHLDLLITPRGNKGSDRITNGAQPRRCHSGSHADGICLSDPGIKKSPWALCFEFVKKPVPDIGTQHHHASILHGDLPNFVGKRVSHGTKWRMKNGEWRMGIMVRFAWYF
jgi:hypothetical protein